MMFVDCRCHDRRCRDADAYRMVGKCLNCRSSPILMLFTAGHACHSIYRNCPACGCKRLTADRLATEDEIPAEATP